MTAREPFQLTDDQTATLQSLMSSVAPDIKQALDTTLSSLTDDRAAQEQQFLDGLRVKFAQAAKLDPKDPKVDEMIAEEAERRRRAQNPLERLVGMGREYVTELKAERLIKTKANRVLDDIQGLYRNSVELKTKATAYNELAKAKDPELFKDIVAAAKAKGVKPAQMLTNVLDTGVDDPSLKDLRERMSTLAKDPELEARRKDMAVVARRMATETGQIESTLGQTLKTDPKTLEGITAKLRDTVAPQLEGLELLAETPSAKPHGLATQAKENMEEFKKRMQKIAEELAEKVGNAVKAMFGR